MASTQDRYSQNNLQGQAGQQGLQQEKTSFTQMWGEPRPVDKLNQQGLTTSGPKSTILQQESFTQTVELPRSLNVQGGTERQEGWNQSNEFRREQEGLNKGGLGQGQLPQAHVYNLPGESLRPEQRESEWRDFDRQKQGEWKGEHGFTDLKSEHRKEDFDDRRDYKENRGDYMDYGDYREYKGERKDDHDRRDVKEDMKDRVREWKDDVKDRKDRKDDDKHREYKDDHKHHRDYKDDVKDRKDWKDDDKHREYKDDHKHHRKDYEEIKAEAPGVRGERKDVDDRRREAKGDYRKSEHNAAWEKGESQRHFGYSDRGTYKVHGEQEEAKMQAARDLLDRTEQGKKLGGTENISQGLSEVEAKLQREAQHAPDRKAADAVRDMAGVIGATQKLVLEKDLGDRMQQIAEDARLAAKEQGVSDRSSVKGAMRTMGDQQPAEILRDNLVPLLRLVIFSKNFRVAVLDLVKILRKIFLRTVNADESSEFGGRIEDHMLSGRPMSEMARDVKEQAKSNWKNEEGKVEVPISDDEIDLLIDDIIDLLAIIKSNEKYNVGIRRIFDMGEMMYAQGASAVGKRSTNMPATQKLKEDTKELIQDVSGRQSLEYFMDRLNVLVDHLRRDQDARDYLSELKEFLLEKHADAEYSDAFNRRVRNLVSRGRAIFDKWNNKSEVSEFLNAADAFLDSVRNDSELSLLRQRAGVLREDFTYVDSEGKRRIDTDLLSNVQSVVVPILADAIKYIPIPMVQYSDAKMEFEAKDIVVCGYDIVPENIFATFESKTALNIKELETEKFRTKLVLEVKNIRTEVKDIEFYFRRKKFPEVSDSGRVSVKLTGRGANLTSTFRISQLSIDSSPKFESAGVDFNITNFAIEFDKSTIKHKVLLPMMTGLFKRQIIRSIETAVENALRPVLAKIGKTMSENNPVSLRMGSKLENVRQNIKNADTHRTLQHRHEMLKGDSLEKKEEKEKRARQSKDTREREHDNAKERRKEHRENKDWEKAADKKDNFGEEPNREKREKEYIDRERREHGDKHRRTSDDKHRRDDRKHY